MLSLILFDIDGTILKFKKSLSHSLVNFVIHNIFKSSLNNEYIPDFAGKTDLMILHELCNKTNYDFENVKNNIECIWEQLLDFFKNYTYKENIVVFPGIKQILSSLEKNPNYKIGLITGNFKENAYLKLSVVNLNNYFPFGAFGNDYEDRNLLPDLAIRRANDYFGSDFFNHNNTLIIGDSIRDIECAKKNNIKIVSVATGACSYETLLEYSPNLIFKNLKNFKTVLREIERLMTENEKDNNCN